MAHKPSGGVMRLCSVNTRALAGGPVGGSDSPPGCHSLPPTALRLPSSEGDFGMGAGLPPPFLRSFVKTENRPLSYIFIPYFCLGFTQTVSRVLFDSSQMHSIGRYICSRRRYRNIGKQLITKDRVSSFLVRPLRRGNRMSM